MLSLKFGKFALGEWESDESHEMYIVKNGEKILYIGISRAGIWNRWFGHFGRIHEEDDGWHGEDLIGQEIVKHLPESLEYTIDLLTIEDAIELCKDEFTGYNLSKVRVEMAERFAIQKLRPALNSAHNYREQIAPDPIKSGQVNPELRRQFDLFSESAKELTRRPSARYDERRGLGKRRQTSRRGKDRR